jgi:hypothetical protein
MKTVKAWVGLVDGTIYFSQQRAGNYTLKYARLAQLFADERECKECCKDCVEVEIREVKRKARSK